MNKGFYDNVGVLFSFMSSIYPGQSSEAKSHINCF